MNKKIWIALTVVVLATAAAVGIGAETRSWPRWHAHMGPWGPAWYITHQLNLNDAQKKQIGEIWQTERPHVADLVRELAAANVDLQKAGTEHNEALAQQSATRQGAVVAQLLLEKEKLRSEIYAQVLTPDQRTKADELQSRFNQHLEQFADRLQHGGPHAN